MKLALTEAMGKGGNKEHSEACCLHDALYKELCY